jgi:hypothetical protein
MRAFTSWLTVPSARELKIELAGPVALAVVDQRALIVLDVAAQLRAMRGKAPGLRRIGPAFGE